jgi:hypothetical protein
MVGKSKCGDIPMQLESIAMLCQWQVSVPEKSEPNEI